MTKPSRRCHPACPHQGGVGLATPGYSTVCMRNGMRWEEGLMRLLVLLLPTQFCWYHQHAASVRDDSDHVAPPVSVPRPYRGVRVRYQMTDHLI